MHIENAKQRKETSDDRRFAASPAALAVIAALSLASACGGEGASATAEGHPNYVLSSVLFDADYNASTSLALLESLDQEQIDWDRAREFPGFADVWVRDGSIFISQEDFTITKFSLEGGRLIERGRLGFPAYGPTDFGFWPRAGVFASSNSSERCEQLSPIGSPERSANET